MHLMLVLTVLAGIASTSPSAAQNSDPKSFADCDALYARELKRYATQTNRNLRETQSKAGLHRLRCERAVERKLIQERAKGNRR